MWRSSMASNTFPGTTQSATPEKPCIWLGFRAPEGLPASTANQNHLNKPIPNTETNKTKRSESCEETK